MQKPRVILAAVAFSIFPTVAQANYGDFSGGVAIGSDYAGVDTAPTNGLLVQGNTSLGTTTSTDSLDVGGAIGLTTTASAPAIGFYAPAPNTAGVSARSLPSIEATNPVSAVDFLLVTGAATANPASVSLLATGSDSNVNLDVAGQGTGGITCNGASCAGASFVTSGTSYTTPASTSTSTFYKFTLYGAGGGGAGCNTANEVAGAGSAGAKCVLYISGLSPSTAYAIAIGSGGSAGNSSPSNGGDGGDTTLTIGATTYTGGGGFGGTVCSPTAHAVGGGGATNCTINGHGNFGISSVGANNLSWGGSCDVGQGGLIINNANEAGAAGNGFCSGGSGSSGVGHAGAVGQPGAIIVEYFN